MRKMKRLLFIVVILWMIIPFVGDVYAETKTQDLDVNIQSGGLILEIPNVEPIGEITISEEMATIDIGFDGPVVIHDLRGSQAGWRLDISATQLTEVESGHQLPTGSLLTHTDAEIRSTTFLYNLALPTVLDAYPYQIDSSPVPFSRATEGIGMGSFEIAFQPGKALFLQVSALTAREGTYQSTITWDLISAP